MGQQRTVRLTRRSLTAIPVACAIAVLAAACSGGGPSKPEQTSTAAALATSAIATEEATTPAPTAKDISDTIRLGFAGLNIGYTEIGIDTFRKPDKLVALLDDCAQDRGQGIDRGDPAFWPAVLGDCYTVGDATKWLYGYTGKREFAYANQLMKRFMHAKMQEANENGAGLDDGYWQLVLDKIYTLSPSGTPVAVTPPAAVDAAATATPGTD